MIKAAATLRTFGYLHNAMIVNRLPVRPTIIIKMATTAAKVLSGVENLYTEYLKSALGFVRDQITTTHFNFR